MELPEAKERAIRALRLDDAEFDRVDDARLLDLSEVIGPPKLTPDTLPRPGAEKRFPEFIAIGGPTLPNWEHPSVPVLVACVISGMRTWNVDEKLNTRLFVTRLATGEVATFRPFYDSPRADPLPPSGSGDPPSSLKNSIQYGVSVANIKAFLPSSWQGEALAVTATYYDQLSNTVLLHSAAPPSAAMMSLPTKPSDGVVSASTPPGEEVEFEAPPHPVLLKDLILKCGIRLSKEEIVAIPREPGGYLCPISIAFVRLDDKNPVVLNLWIHVQPDGEHLRGAFQVRVAAVALPRPVKGTYMAYLIAGTRMRGPCALEILP